MEHRLQDFDQELPVDHLPLHKFVIELDGNYRTYAGDVGFRLSHCNLLLMKME